MRTELKKLPVLEENMSLISKSIENINAQMEKQQTQQQAILKYIEGIIREKAVTTIELEGSPSGGMGSDFTIKVLAGELKGERKSEDDKALGASLRSFDGPALGWYRSQNERESFTSWDDLKQKMLRRFQTIRDGTLVDRFFTVKQESMMEEYRNRFDKYLALIAFLQTVVLEETFMNGLSPWLKTKVDVLEPRGVYGSKFQYNLPKTKEGTETKAMAATTSGNTPMKTVTLKGVTVADNRREGPSKPKEHKELRILVVRKSGEEFEIIEEDGGEEVVDEKVIEVGTRENLNIEISINSVVELTNPRTMKVKDEDVGVLTSCGATHNFISEKLVTNLNLPLKATTNYGVILGSGAAIKGKGICGKVEVLLDDWKVVDSFLPLELGGVDVILGMQ
ncbi:ty3-gypsy retrotransposon protein [Cucumis melo var. makuwa]|uniref:Ty3-gypsy retrotransposon protein n=1 Tax=Cucumis melo var. makuwa TaxID=1194695 RepID=A0A5D3BLM7_CUCMM|nr:ty3-gypsy retrotransposon protein [Cucumis melo var. makuwa]